MTSRSLGHRAPLLWLVLPFAAGLVAGRCGELVSVPWQLLAAAVAASVAIFAAWHESRAWAPAVAVAMFLAGSAAYPMQRHRLPAWDALPPREVKLSVRVDRVFPNPDPKRLNGLGVIVHADSLLADLAGQRVYLGTSVRRDDPRLRRSAIVAVAGVLAPVPRNPAPDSFDGYLAASGVNFRLTRARVVAEEQPPRVYYRFCNAAAARFRADLGLGIEQKRPALAGLLRAMMLGETHELTEDQHTIFMQSGTMHLFAISGLNIAVIAGAIEALLLLFRLPRWVRFVTGTMLLWLFVDITGAAPSAVRAFAMAMFLRTAFVLRRPANPLAALVASAFVVLLIAPLQLFSASFLMSYAIVLALLVLGLPLSETWSKGLAPWRDIPKATWPWWQKAIASGWAITVTALAIGVATMLVSLLTGVQFFRLLTPGSLLANLVLIPAAVVVTLGGFGTLLCGLVGFGPGAILCNHASALVLLLIEALVRSSVRMPWAYVPAQFVAPWVGPVALGALMIALLAGYAARWRWERGGWLPPFVIVVLTLVFGTHFGP